MKLNRLISGIGSLVVASYALSFSERDLGDLHSLEKSISQIDTLEIFESKPIKFLSKRDSLNILDFGYAFNEKDLSKFNSWIDSTINESRINNSYAIIVNKADYKLFLYKDGLKQKEFPIELGWNPYDDKQVQGDKATPEGMYKIVEKFANETNFHKAFLIDYPNAMDIKEFNELKNKNKIPSDAKIGGAIEIHGRGSGYAGGLAYVKVADAMNIFGQNWTHGCIALSNEYIDQVFSLVPRGTRVTIVKYADREL